MNDESLPDWKIRLSQRERDNHLEWAEGQIMKGFAMAANALADVKEKGSWRGKYSSFFEWARHALNLSAPRVCQLLEARQVMLSLKDSRSDEVVEAANEMSETAFRVVAPLEKKKRESVVRRARRDGDLTARHLKEIINPEVIPPASKLCPHCHRPMPVRKKASSIPD